MLKILGLTISHITSCLICWSTIALKRLNFSFFKSSYSFLTFLLILGGLATFSSSDASGKSFRISTQDKTLIQEGQLPTNHDQAPVNPVPVSEEEDQRENTDEKEYNDLGSFYANNHLSLYLNPPYWLSLRQLDKTIYNRKTVSLFILFHTWKSYLG